MLFLAGLFNLSVVTLSILCFIAIFRACHLGVEVEIEVTVDGYF